MKNKPKLSIVVIAKKEEELYPLLDVIKKQTYDNFEVVISTKGNAPQAWNDAIRKAKGDYLVFTESDARPLNENWLEDIALHVKPGCVIKGIEIRPTDFDLCNTIFDASIFTDGKYFFDEKLEVCEDSELFARLRKNGYKLINIESFPVVHVQKISWRNTFKRAFKQGLFFAKMMHLYGFDNVDSINTQSFSLNRKPINPINNRLREIIHNILVLSGGFLGLIVYAPKKIWKQF